MNTKTKTTNRKGTTAKRNRKARSVQAQTTALALSAAAFAGEIARQNEQHPMQLTPAQMHQLSEHGRNEAAMFLITRATERHFQTLPTQERGLAMGIDNLVVQLIQNDPNIAFLRESLTPAAFARIITVSLRGTAAGIEAAHYAHSRLRMAA